MTGQANLTLLGVDYLIKYSVGALNIKPVRKTVNVLTGGVEAARFTTMPSEVQVHQGNDVCLTMVLCMAIEVLSMAV